MVWCCCILLVCCGGTQLLRGRAFADSDNTSSRNVAIVNQAFVRQILHGKNPIGLHFGDWSPSITGTYEIGSVLARRTGWRSS